MQVVVLAAGQGKRLRPLTHDRPKSMLSVAGRPIIHHLLENLAALGVQDVILVVGHGHERVQSYVGDGALFGLKVRYAQQSLQLGPGHALHQARDLIQKQQVLLLPADSWYHRGLLQRFLAASGPTLVAVPDVRSVRHGIPVMRGGKAADLREGHGGDEGRASGGAYLLPVRLLATLEAVGFSLRDAIRRDMAENAPWSVLQAQAGEYIDVIEVEDLLSLHALLMATIQVEVQGTIEPGVQTTGPVHVGPGSVVRSGSVLIGPVYIGENCEVGPLAVLQPDTSIRNHVRIEPFCILSSCLVQSNVTIGSHSRVHAAILDNGVTVGSGSRVEGGSGIMVGSDAVLGADVTVRPGGRIGFSARIAAGRIVREVPDHGVAV